MAVGTTGAFATVQPLQRNDIGDALQQVEENGFRYRAEKRLEDEKKAKAEADKQKALDDDLSKINAQTTGYGSPDAVAIGAGSKLRDAVADKWREMQSGKISSTEYNIFKQNALSEISAIDQANKRINTQASDYAKQVADGKIDSAFAEDAKKFGGVYDNGNIYTEVGPDGKLVLIPFEKSQDGKIIPLGRSDVKSFGSNAFTPIPNYDIESDMAGFRKSNEPDLTESLGYTTKTGTKGLTPRLERVIDAKVDAIVADPLTLASVYSKISGEAKRILSEDEKKLAKDYLVKRYEGMYNTEKTIDEATQRANLNLSERKYKDDKEKEQIVSFGQVETPPQYEETGIKPREGYKTVSISGKQVPVNVIKAKEKDGNGKVTDKSYNLATLKSYTVTTKPDGQRAIVGEISYPDIKTSTLSEADKDILEIPDLSATTEQKAQKELVLSKVTKGAEYKTKIVNLTEEDAFKFAKNMGLKNVNEMKDASKNTEAKKPKYKGLDANGMPIFE